MQIPRQLLNNYTSSINGLSRNAQQGVANVMSRFEFTDDVAADRERIISLMTAALRPYMQHTTRLAVGFYNVLRVWSLGEELADQPDVDDIYDASKTDNAVRAFMQKAVDGNHAAIAPLLMERIDYELKKAAADAVLEMGRRDKAKVKYARVPTGAETCEWCLMLAGLGFHYNSEEAASHVHKGCDCRIVPSFGKDTVEDYIPAEYRNGFYRSVQERADKAGISYEEAYERRYGTAARTRRAGNRSHK